MPLTSSLALGGIALAVLPSPTPQDADPIDAIEVCAEACYQTWEQQIEANTQTTRTCNNNAVAMARTAYTACGGDPACQTMATAELLARQIACLTDQDDNDIAANAALEQCLAGCFGS